MNASCAVIIPVYRRPTPSERLSLMLAEKFFPSKSRYIVMPESLNFSPVEFQIKRLPNHYFDSVKGYASLMVNKLFYENFAGFDYILIYQLDCLVFSERLSEFCSLGYDYVAPLILGRSDGLWPSRDIVGVGGFSLRKVSSFLRVLNLIEKPEFAAEACSLANRIERNGAEDIFWSLAAPVIDPDFSVASPESALAFGFEGDPHKSYIRAYRQKPFGCHHWNKLSFFIWYFPWIPLPLLLKVRYLCSVGLELFIIYILHILIKVKSRIRSFVLHTQVKVNLS